jgi:endonuclease/exonuclease/phosphatase family metal-dependent hydrolase
MKHGFFVRIFFVEFLCFAAPFFCRAEPGEVVFAAYNLENYLTSQSGAPKPEHEIAALVRIVKDINPDILGVCEMGPRDQFEDFKKRLADAGLGYTDFEYIEGPDEQRHLALLSRLPITAHESLADVPFTLNGRQEKIKRGILDVTVKLDDTHTLRLIGVHLKSKLAVPEGDALIRRNEAHLLRGHIEKILAADPVTRLLLYGDFNDTKNEPAVHEVMGPRGAADSMSDLLLKDRLGDRWTHYWKIADIYSRIDYIFASPALLPNLLRDKCSIYRSEDWNEASDHRPIIATLKTSPQK